MATNANAADALNVSDEVASQSVTAAVADRGGRVQVFRCGTSGFRLALAVGLTAVLAIGGLDGWLGCCAYRVDAEDQLRQQFLAVGKQEALNPTTIDHTEAEVKPAQSKIQGTATAAGLESVERDRAQ